MGLRFDNTYIINLDKDKERLSSVLKECKNVGINNPTRIQAVYGKELTKKELSENVSKVFSRIGLKSAIGCALSHLKAWKKMVKNGDEYALFLEDDIYFEKDFQRRIKDIKVPEDFGIFYLGCVLGCDINKEYGVEFPFTKLVLGNGGKYVKKVEKINENVFVPSLPLALHGYILSRKAAVYLIENVEKDKIYHHIDAQILKYIYNIPSYSTTPQLILQKDVDVNTSNNINSGYPVIITKHLNDKDKYGVPMNYKMSVGIYDIFGYTINSITSFVVILGFLLGASKTPLKNVVSGFIIITALEAIENIRVGGSISKKFVTNTVVTMSLLYLSYQGARKIF